MAPIRKASNENIRPPENQKVSIFRNSLKKKACGCNLSPPQAIQKTPTKNLSIKVRRIKYH